MYQLSNDNKDSTKTSLGIREWFWGEYKNCRKLQNLRPSCRRIVLNLGIEVVSHVGTLHQSASVMIIGHYGLGELSRHEAISSCWNKDNITDEYSTMNTQRWIPTQEYQKAVISWKTKTPILLHHKRIMKIEDWTSYYDRSHRPQCRLQCRHRTFFRSVLWTTFFMWFIVHEVHIYVVCSTWGSYLMICGS